MTDRQSNSLDMFLVVRTFHTNNALILDTVPARAAAFGLHSTRITAINAIASAQSGNITGIATDKAILRSALDTLAFDHMTAALVWARLQSNNTLAAEFDYTRSDIEKVKDDSIIAFCQHRYQIMDANSATLADYGILPATLAAWQTAMTAYEPLVPGPRSARVSKKVLTAQLKTLFKQTNDHLRDILDPLMLALRASQPDIYLGYQSSRIIIDLKGPGNGDSPTPPATTDIIVSGTIYAVNISNPLPNATITILVGTTPYAATANNLGQYSRKIPAAPTNQPATITASATDHTPDSRQITIPTSGNLTEDFILQPTPPIPPTPPTP